MKKALYLFVLSAFLSPLVFPALNEGGASGAQKAKVAVSEADIFLEASQYSIVIDTVPKETVVTLFPSGMKNKKWLYISYFSEKRNSQVTGFIARNRVELMSELPGESREIREKNREIAEPENPVSEVEGLPEEIREPAATMETPSPVEQQEAIEDKPVLEENVEDRPDTEENPDRKMEEKEPIDLEKPPMEASPPTGKAQKTEDMDLPKVLTKVSVTVAKANIRLMPTTNSSIIHQAPSGTELKHLAKTGNWHRVNLAPNEEGLVLSGYIHQSIVREIFETAAPPPPEPETIPEAEPEITKAKSEPGPGPVKELPDPRTKAAQRYFWFGGGAGYTMPSQSDFAKGLNFGGTLGYGLTKHLAVELRIPYFQSDVSGTAEGLSSGRLSRLSIMLSAQVRYPIRKRFAPYLVAGGDFHWNTFRLDESIAKSWSDLGYTFEERVDHAFGFHFGAGLDVFLLENLALNLDARYYTAGLSGKWTLSDQDGQEVTSGTFSDMTLDSLQAGISVKLFLNPLRRKQ